MALTIKTNIPSVNAQRQLEKSTNALKDSMEKISSGERINKGADDAAGLAISENLKSGIRSLNVARRNANDGISVLQTAEGGLSETGNMLIRLRELAIQSASDTISDRERGFLDLEYLQLKNEIDRVATSTEFNGTRLLSGNNQLPDDLVKNSNQFPLEIQVGKDYYNGADALDKGNPVNIIRIDLQRINSFTSGEGSLELGQNEEGTRVNNKQAAQQSLSVLDEAINRISSDRAYIGAIQNRLGSAIANLGTRIENLTESNSRIRDTDYAASTAQMAQNNIMQQAGTSVLANANTQPQIALALLQQ